MSTRDAHSRTTLFAAAALAAIAAWICLSAGLWSKPLSMDNRLYFYIAERAASGVSPHVSTPDVKNQLSTLADSLSIRAGRIAGADDVRAGRLGMLVILILGVWGVGCSVYAVGATRSAATLGALSVFAFSNLSGHTAVGFNPKILLFTLLAWGPWFVARGRFGWGGAFAAAAMMSWQPAAAACLGAALGALTDRRALRALIRVIAGGVAVFALYEAYFAWHGVMLAQLFQSYGLPLGSVHEEVDWLSGLRFVLTGSRHGIDRFALPGLSFFALTLGAAAALLGLRIPPSGRTPAPAPAIALLAVGGSLMVAFTMYEHQAEPDRFLLCAYYAIAIGVVADRALRLLRERVNERSAFQLQGALAAVLLLSIPRSDSARRRPETDLAGQADAGKIIAMMSEAYGTVWAYGCIQLMGLAHISNFHPVDHFWDDLRRYVDEDTFEPVVQGALPDMIVRCRRIPGSEKLLEAYVEVPAPHVAESMHIYVRRELHADAADVDEAPSQPGARHKGLGKRRARRLRA
ncbi:MAG TPA: hypothetical protein VN634_19985 [Candidatus Limnocylindrales bacterium]|nr:hypothetical protein [Candidatus Limnocylindrales bacterium]